jgi:hypothetical protein
MGIYSSKIEYYESQYEILIKTYIDDIYSSLLLYEKELIIQKITVFGEDRLIVRTLIQNLVQIMDLMKEIDVISLLLFYLYENRMDIIKIYETSPILFRARILDIIDAIIDDPPLLKDMMKLYQIYKKDKPEKMVTEIRNMRSDIFHL